MSLIRAVWIEEPAAISILLRPSKSSTAIHHKMCRNSCIKRRVIMLVSLSNRKRLSVVVKRYFPRKIRNISGHQASRSSISSTRRLTWTRASRRGRKEDRRQMRFWDSTQSSQRCRMEQPRKCRGTTMKHPSCHSHSLTQRKSWMEVRGLHQCNGLTRIFRTRLR